jgi:glutamate-1-semialdehyde 2,1-aminomutase
MLPSALRTPITEDGMENSVQERLVEDRRLRTRASEVLPGGMYGHQSVAKLPASYPQFMARGEGVRVWDVDGNEYIDLMCGYGPVLLGHHHPRVDEAAGKQASEADVQNTPSARMVELAEAFTARVQHADWAMFCKNGTDATTICASVARAATGRRKVLVAAGAYHGSAPWCTPVATGTTPEDRANLLQYRYNDVESAVAAANAAGDDLAAIIVSPIRHDLGVDLELPEPSFAAGLRDLADRTGAALILDDVRCGLRLNNGGSWEYLGVQPDLSARSKAIANGYALGAVTGTSALAAAASSIYVTGSFWYGAVAMAASLATLQVVEEEDTVAHMVKTGTLLRNGLRDQAASHGVEVRLSGPVQMPFLTFAADRDFALAAVFADQAIRNGVWLHPTHNWFVSAAMTEADVDRVLEATDLGFAAVAARQ